MDDNSILDKQAALQEYREASALYKQGEFPEALAILERLLAVYPKHETVRIAIAMCRKALGEPAPASESSETGELDAVPESASDPDYLEPPTPVPFVYDFAVPAGSEDAPAAARPPWWPMPAAMTAGVLIGLLAGIGIKETLAVLQHPGASPLRIDAGPLPDPAGGEALAAAAPATLLLGPEDRAAIETSEDAGEFAAAARAEAPGPWNPTPVWTKDGLTAWTSGLGDFFVYAPAQPKHAALFVHGAPLDPADRPRIALDLAARPIVHTFAERTGAVVVVPVFDAARYPDHAHLGGKSQAAALFATAVLDAVIERYALPDRRALFYGHSAGAQFVHRYSLVHPERVLRAALSAPGAYVMPDDDRPWPDGLAACPNPRAYEWTLRIPALVVVGDGDPRQETARTWLRALERLPRESERPNIALHRVHDARHSGERLLPAALEFLVP